MAFRWEDKPAWLRLVVVSTPRPLVRGKLEEAELIHSASHGTGALFHGPPSHESLRMVAHFLPRLRWVMCCHPDLLLQPIEAGLKIYKNRKYYEGCEEILRSIYKLHLLPECKGYLLMQYTSFVQGGEGVFTFYGSADEKQPTIPLHEI